MSTVRSLGLHESSAIPFLVAEGLLPPDPSENLYSWTTSVDTRPGGGAVEDELVWTKSCVVWSRAGVIKRVFRLDMEKEDIKHVLLTNFAVGKVERSSDKSSSATSSHKSNNHASHLPDAPPVGTTESGYGRKGPSKTASRALVVVLKSQAHIFSLEGNSHVVPLPFEVDSVFATPLGLLFQRKIAEDNNPSHPTAPPNSFMSFAQDFRASQSLEHVSGKAQRPSLSTIPSQSPGWKSRTNKRVDLPRVFSLMDPHSEMGLVVTNQASRWVQTSLSSRPSGFDVLDPADEIIYVSPKDELSGACRANPNSPLILVLTVNTNTGLYTLWTARYREDETGPSSKKKRRRETGGTRSKRRSSHFGMTTGTTTPGARPPAARESFGPRGDNWNASVMSHSRFSTEGNPEDDEDDFASKLGQDFGDIGVPSKTSRRVSSMLARTDLATSQDRITFSDLATGSQSSTIHPGGLRQSIGAGSTRASLGFNPRGSLPPGAGSIYSTTGSFVDAPVDRLLEELNNENLFEGIENMDLKESASGLPEEVVLTKVESFSSRFSGNFLAPSKLKPSKKLKVVTLCPTDYASAQIGDLTSMALYVVDQEAKSMTVVNIRAESVRVPAKDTVFSKRSKSKTSINERTLLVSAYGSIQHLSGVLDVCKIVDGEISRLVTLNVADGGVHILHLQTPWNGPVVLGLPTEFMLHETDALSSIMTMSLPREGSMKRVMTDSSITLVGLDHPAVDGKFDVVDSAKRRHKVRVQLEPSNTLVRKAFSVCRFALAGYFHDRVADGLLVGWWETLTWLHERETSENDLEWTALVVVLFSLATPFIESDQSPNTTRQPRRKKGLLRSSSGSYADTESWESMLDQESGSAGVVAPWMNTSSWGWIIEQDAEDESTASHGTKPLNTEQSSSSRSTCRKNTYLIRCTALAREFLQTPRGIVAFGADGPLRTALANSEHSPYTAICTVLVALHLLREEQKLSACDDEQSHRSLGLLAPVLAQLGGWIGWPNWNWAESSYYGMEIASINRWQFENTRMSLGTVPVEPLNPPSVFAFLEHAWRGQSTMFWSLLNLVHSDEYPRRGKLWQWCYTLTPRTLSLDGFVDEMRSKSSVLQRIQLLHRWGLTRSVIETFPEGVSTPLYEAILQSQTHATTLWNPTLLGLVDRDDLSISMGHLSASRPPPPSLPIISHDALRDYHHIGNSALEIDTINSFEASAEADRFSVTKLIFRDDKRFIEAARLLNQSKAPAAECTPEPEWTDSDLLEAQKEVVQLVTMRTLSIPTGRAMLAFSGRLPLLTEKLPIPSFSLQCVMKPSNVTISADRASFSEEKVCWAFFHNGVSTGLAISRNSKGIDTSWILFNKPQELTNRHAGFLLALGLNGHLRSLAKWVAFKYLTPKHTMTSIGLLLGLSASYLGTMDTLITRLLSVHVTRMLPLGAAELNLSPLTQTAGIMGIGLLYCNSQHRRMSEVMLSEIENAEAEEGTASHEGLRDEGYRLAAGLSLGFINLGKGKDLKGMRDMHIVERLLAVAVGTKNVDLAHVLDRATAGATIALAIIFMKTNDETLAHKVDIPDTTIGFDYVRPDLFLLRTLARHVIMWDRIQPCDEWFVQSLPEVYRRRYRLTGVRRLKSNDMPFFNIIAGLCFALGLRYSGSANPRVRDILLFYLDQFIRISRLPAASYDGKLTRNSVRHCQDVLALSAAAVVAGTGDLALFRRLRSLHGRVDPDTPYGSHMAAHMAIGMLFLGGGSYTLGTSNLAVASLICSLYPIFPTTVLDNKCHLQAFRHLWVLAAEPRCLVPRDLDSRRPVSIPISITSSSGDSRILTAPCLLPDLGLITKVEVRSPDYWPLVLDFASNSDVREKFQQGDQSIYLRRKATYNPTGTSVFGSTLAGLSGAQDILPSSSTLASNQGKGLSPSALPNVSALLSNNSHRFTPKPAAQSIWDWIFQLQSLHGLLDAREKELVLPSSFPTRPRPSPTPHDAPWLRQSAVDSKLLTESTVQNVIQAAKGRGANPDEVRDRLWQLQLLFSWIDAGSFPSESYEEQQEREISVPSRGLWLRKDYVEELRWKIWGVQTGDHGGPESPQSDK
ncbi:anaphase promoting complex subunit 1 [Aspergillus puulaauensis]|uniref:Anaphase-promoting complex subunit 1 n=1 Tax=Aspergillus puulaauensis TaxID=1220207 RepID=A0A7R7XK46_9EURO|nr:anaphase-promoting complex subunit 1 [Aspergillus puulaauensis]BCS22966.1 anaphase-promoting complex subunit 1 [Aspergillus puulaauensis]